MVILARRYWPKECERCNWWCGTNDNATQAGPSTRGDGHRRSGAARDEEATEIQFKPKSRCDVRPGILPGKMSAYRLKHREEWIGWNPSQKKRRLSLVANNSRFLILEGWHEPN